MGLSAGVRHDKREQGLGLGVTLPNASPILSQQGGRTDAVIRIDYRPLLARTPAPVRWKRRLHQLLPLPLSVL